MEKIHIVKVHDMNASPENDEEYFFRRREDAVEFVVNDYFGYAGVLADEELEAEIRQSLDSDGSYDDADVMYSLFVGQLR